MNTEKELDAIGDFLSAAIGGFADRDQKQGDAIDHSVRTGEPLFATRCETVAVSNGNDATATLSLRNDGLWLTLKTPRGSASFNLEFKLDYHDTRKSSISERVAVDYFKRIK